MSKDKSCCAKRGCRKPKTKKSALCAKHHSRKFRELKPDKYAFANLRHHANRRGIEFTLTFEQFIEVAKPAGYIEAKGRTARALHIDRIDNSLGYVAGNIQVITASENCSKGCKQTDPGADLTEFVYGFGLRETVNMPYWSVRTPPQAKRRLNRKCQRQNQTSRQTNAATAARILSGHDPTSTTATTRIK